MAGTSAIDDAVIDRVREAAATLSPLSSQIEEGRRLPAVAVEALVSSGLFKLLVPRIYGGGEASLSTVLAAIEEVARADGSAGWCAMIGVTSGLMSVFLPDDVAREVYGADDAVTCGVFAPMGRATRAAGGYRVTGRWPFASGCEHSRWRMGGAIVTGDPPDLLPSGAPNVRSMLFAADDTLVIDTWHTSGLRGTGSHDLEVRDVFVPEARSFSLITDRPRIDTPAYRIPFFGVLAAGVASVALGIARSAVDAASALVKQKQAPGAKRTVAHRELVQMQIAEAEARVRASRAFLFAEVAAILASPGELLEARALLRLAAWHATKESALAVDLAYAVGGASAIYTKNPLQRHFRDVHVATQHVMVAPVSATLAGRILLDVESDTSTL